MSLTAIKTVAKEARKEENLELPAEEASFGVLWRNSAKITYKFRL